MLGIFRNRDTKELRPCRSREEEIGQRAVSAPWELGQALDRLFASHTALAIVNLPEDEPATKTKAA